jgi:glycosyltransferase involved in cell wall biosynthesis
MSAPLPISVIIPCYRCGNTLARAVDSVVRQTARPGEIILIDDGSEDNTGTTIHSLQEKLGADWVKVIAQRENRGPGTARNAGWEAASQPLLAFLDADDSWHPNKLEIQYQWMAAHPEAALSGHPCRVLGEGETPPELPAGGAARRIGKPRLLLSNCFPTPSVMLRRDLPFRFPEDKKCSEDYLLWLQIVASGAPAYLLPAPLTFLYKARFGESGLSGGLWEMEKGQLDTYARLRRAGQLSWPGWLLLFPYSLVKFLRRVIVRRLGRK